MAPNTNKNNTGKGFNKIWIVPGLLCLGLGSIGIALPILPTIPFYLAALFCFAKGSQKLYDWFVQTNLYQQHLEEFVKNRSMKCKTKVSVIIAVTLVMGTGFLLMGRVPVGRVVLAIVWLAHIIYFCGMVKTEGKETGCDQNQID